MTVLPCTGMCITHLAMPTEVYVEASWKPFNCLLLATCAAKIQTLFFHQSNHNVACQSNFDTKTNTMLCPGNWKPVILINSWICHSCPADTQKDCDYHWIIQPETGQYEQVDHSRRRHHDEKIGSVLAIVASYRMGILA